MELVISFDSWKRGEVGISHLSSHLTLDSEVRRSQCVCLFFETSLVISFFQVFQAKRTDNKSDQGPKSRLPHYPHFRTLFIISFVKRYFGEEDQTIGMWTLLRPRLSSHVLKPILGQNPNNRYVDSFQSSFKIPFEVFDMRRQTILCVPF